MIETEQAHAAVEHHEFADCRVADGDVQINRTYIRDFQSTLRQLPDDTAGSDQQHTLAAMMALSQTRHRGVDTGAESEPAFVQLRIHRAAGPVPQRR